MDERKAGKRGKQIIFDLEMMNKGVNEARALLKDSSVRNEEFIGTS